jgi:hypothetical protein
MRLGPGFCFAVGGRRIRGSCRFAGSAGAGRAEQLRAERVPDPLLVHVRGPAARLGELERHLGDGVIKAIVAAALQQGRLKRRQRRRIMSYPLVIRLMLAMALMPDASHCEALARLAGLLAEVPFALEWHVPTEKVVTAWRALVPAGLMEALFWRAAGPLIADDEPSAVLLAGMMVCAADGMLVNVADTPANRAMFGCTGTAAQEGEGPRRSRSCGSSP